MTLPPSVWPEVILFDCDGVLVDSESVAASVLSAWAAERLGLSPSQVRRFVDGIRGKPTRSLLTVTEVQHAGVGSSELDELDRHVDQVVRREACIMGGAGDVIASLPTMKAIVSNASLDWVVEVARRVGPGLFGTNLFSSSQVGRAKPFPDVYEHAIYRMDVSPGLCVAVEDSVAGVTAARRAGIPVIGFVRCNQEAHLAKRLLRAGAVGIAQGMPSIAEQICTLSSHQLSRFGPR